MALSLNGATIERFAMAPRGHAELVLPWVKELLAEAGTGLRQLDAIAFSRGPGSFTSLRIGISIVQGLAWGADLPVVPLSSLQIVAQGAAALAGTEQTLVAMDARMGEVFCGLFERDGTGIMRPRGPERVCPPEVAAGLVEAGTSGVGCGFQRFPALSESAGLLGGVYADIWPRAATMSGLAEDWLQSHEPLSAAEAQPVYLRDKVAEKQPVA